MDSIQLPGFGQHVTEEEIRALINRTLEESRISAVRAHIGICSRCLDLFKSIMDENEG